MSETMIRLKCCCGAEADFTSYGYPSDALEPAEKWLTRHEVCLQPKPPAAAPSGETPSIPDCDHQWASDTRGTFCVKCGTFSSTTFPSFVYSGLGGVGGAET